MQNVGKLCVVWLRVIRSKNGLGPILALANLPKFYCFKKFSVLFCFCHRGFSSYINLGSEKKKMQVTSTSEFCG